MTAGEGRTMIVTGATGRQGGAVARHLLQAGWRVRALTRDPTSRKARALQALGAELVRGDMADRASLRPAFRDGYGVFSVQNPAISGAAGVPGTGVLQWDLKLEIEAHLRRLGLPVTVLRPTALMELMTDPAFYPAASMWYVMPKLAGGGTPIPWIAAADIGALAALAFAHPERFLGRELRLASDVRSVDE